jgi:hypothetical protein
MEIIQVAEWTVEFGGEEPSGWLPGGAGTPLPTPRVRTDLAFAILSEGDEGGYILEWRGPTPETSNDSWHPSVEAAVLEAERRFGVPKDAWTKLDASGNVGRRRTSG